MTNAIPTIKLQQRKLNLLLEDLNNLSVQRYTYRYGQQDGVTNHYIYCNIKNQRIMFRYFKDITDAIQLVQNLIKYRTLEYETEVDDE